MSNVVVLQQSTAATDIETPPDAVVVIEASPPQTVEIVAQGPQGIPGPQGPAGTDALSIVGYPVLLTNGQPDDLLSFTGSGWSNKPQTQVTDGGNF